MVNTMMALKRRLLGSLESRYVSMVNQRRQRQQQQRHHATSAQKRKWKRQQQQQTGNKQFINEVVDKHSNSSSSSGTMNWRPIFFLGVFPLIMSGVVVLLRDDLREELEEKGIGRFLKDIKQLRTIRAIELEQKQEAKENEKELEENNHGR